MTKITIAAMIFAGCIVHTHSFAADMPQYTRTDYPIHDVARFIFTGSENGDSRPDVIVVDKSGAINVLLAGPNAVYGTSIVTETGLKEPKTSIADDFNNDGLMDVCINDTLFVSTGSGEFSTPRPLGIERLQTLASTDMNGDGKKDLIAIAIINTTSDMRSAEIRTCFGNGDGTFQNPTKTRIVFTSGEINWQPGAGEVIDDSGEYYIRHIGDLTDDGIPDMIVRRIYTTNGWVLYFNWTFNGTSSGGFNKNSLYSPENGYSTKVGDFNNDGMMDIMENGSFYIGNNQGKFLNLWSVDNDFFSPVVSVADVNGDGILDLMRIRLISDSSASYYHLVAMIGNNTGKNKDSFSEKYEYSLRLPDTFPYYGNSTFPIGSHYLNNDLCADIIIPGRDSAFLAVILSTSSVNIDSEMEPLPVHLGQNTPNPFNASTTIPYSIFRPGIYELAVYDMLGRKIVTLVSGFQPSGEHRVVWNVQDKQGVDVASGCYFYILKEKGGKAIIASKKLLLMK